MFQVRARMGSPQTEKGVPNILRTVTPAAVEHSRFFTLMVAKKATRERDLIMPLAKKLGIQPGKTPLTKGGPDNIACDIMGKKANSYASELSEDIQDVLIVWEHGCIPRLAKSLGASDHPNPWPSLCGSWKADRNNSESNAGCYDQIWTFKYGSNSVKTGSEGFMGDISRCNIRPKPGSLIHNATESA